MLSFPFLLLALAACGSDGGSGPSVGAVRVTTTTTGEDVPSAPYTVSVGELAPLPVADGMPIVVVGVPGGARTVTLQDVPANCQVTSGASHTVQVVGGDTVTAAFAVGCTTIRGAVKVVVATSGDVPDPNGYAVNVGGVAATVGSNDSVTVSGVLAGDRQLVLGGVATNCTATPVATTVSVQVGQVARVAIDVSCKLGHILYTTRLSNAAATPFEVFAIDPDGSGAVQLTHEVDPRYAVAPDWSPDRTRIAYSVIDGSAGYTSSIVVMNVDGSGRLVLTPSNVSAFGPHWSPDGTRILYTVGPTSIWVMNADGSNQTKLTTINTSYRNPIWSRDGARIFYLSRPEFSSGDLSLYVMNADGSGQTQLSPTAIEQLTNCALSPDGSKLVFDRDVRPDATQPVNQDLFMIGADGANPATLLGTTAFEGAGCWSPDGSQVLFISDRDGGPARLWLMNTDATNIRLVPGITTAVSGPSWR